MFIRYGKTKNQLIKPIVCPRCKSKEISIITEYHKSIICRIVAIVIIAIIFYLLRDNFKDILQGDSANTGLIIPILFLALFITKIAQYLIESKTNIQCVCKDCGYVWFHDENS